MLLIDDDEYAAAYVQRALPDGYTMTYAACLDDGMRLLAQGEYELIMTDLRMPGTTNGEALTKMLEVCPHVPVMVITQLHFPGYGASLIRQGAVWVTFKPDAALEPEVAERLLGEAMIFAVARHDAQQQALLSLSANAAAIDELKREVRELRATREQIAILHTRGSLYQEDIQALQVACDRLQAQLTGQAAEREKGKWGVWARVIAVAGTVLAAIVGPMAASRWGKP